MLRYAKVGKLHVDVTYRCMNFKRNKIYLLLLLLSFMILDNITYLRLELD